jgi:hypothetical protein
MIIIGRKSTGTYVYAYYMYVYSNMYLYVFNYPSASISPQYMVTPYVHHMTEHGCHYKDTERQCYVIWT